jgi:3-oxoacyl-[acyl-carrier protein] reductase
MSFEGKVAYVAGAGGMGLRIAQDLIQAGTHVALADMKPALGDLPSGPGSHGYFQGDLTDEGFVQKTMAEWERKHGRLDFLVNTTGVLLFGRDQSCLDMDLEVWERVMTTNLKSFVLTTRHAVPAMKRAGGGAIVHFSSIDALRGDDRPQDAYGCSKAAIIRLSKSLAIQLARERIRSNVVLPGPVHTPMQARWDKDPAALDRLSDFVPMGRIGTVEDMANACLFLLSEKAAFITGTELIVDGGITARP